MANIVEFLNEVVNDTDVVSVQSTDVLDDGYIGVLGDLVNGEMDLYKFEKINPATKNGAVMVVGSDVYMDSFGSRIGYKDPGKITYPAKRPVRAYRLRVGMRFKIDKDAIDGTCVKGKFVIPKQSDYQLTVANDLSNHTVGLVFVVEDVKNSIFVGKSVVDAVVVRVDRV